MPHDDKLPTDRTLAEPPVAIQLMRRRRLWMILKVIELRLRFIILMAANRPGLRLMGHPRQPGREVGPAERGTAPVVVISGRCRIVLSDAPERGERTVGPVPDLRHVACAAQARRDRSSARRRLVTGPARTRADCPGGHPDRCREFRSRDRSA